MLLLERDWLNARSGIVQYVLSRRIPRPSGAPTFAILAQSKNNTKNCMIQFVYFIHLTRLIRLYAHRLCTTTSHHFCCPSLSSVVQSQHAHGSIPPFLSKFKTFRRLLKGPTTVSPFFEFIQSCVFVYRCIFLSLMFHHRYARSPFLHHKKNGWIWMDG